MITNYQVGHNPEKTRIVILTNNGEIKKSIYVFELSEFESKLEWMDKKCALMNADLEGEVEIDEE